MEENAKEKKLLHINGKRNSVKTVIRRNRSPIVRLLGSCFFLMTAVLSAGQAQEGQSLFPPNHPGLFSGRNNWKAGDIILVNIEEKTTLNVRSARTSGRMTSFKLGSEVSESPLSIFPPANSTSDFSLKADSQREFQGMLSVRVVSSESDGTLVVRGRRVLTLAGGIESLELEGRVNKAHIRAGEVALGHIADLILTVHVPSEGGNSLTSEVMESEQAKTLLSRYWNQFLDSMVTRSE